MAFSTSSELVEPSKHVFISSSTLCFQCFVAPPYIPHETHANSPKQMRPSRESLSYSDTINVRSLWNTDFMCEQQSQLNEFGLRHRISVPKPLWCSNWLPITCRFRFKTARTPLRYGVFMATNMKNAFIWDVTPCGSCRN
jgi:hypothetical protein